MTGRRLVITNCRPPCRLFCLGAADTERCYSSMGHMSYLGTWNTTYNGKQCQRWDSQTPHEFVHKYIFTEGSSTAAENYCRNPDGEPCLWCYTMDPDDRWQCCNIWICMEHNGKNQQIESKILIMPCDFIIVY